MKVKVLKPIFMPWGMGGDRRMAAGDVRDLPREFDGWVNEKIKEGFLEKYEEPKIEKKEDKKPDKKVSKKKGK